MSGPTRDDLRMISFKSYDDFTRTAAKKILELLEEKDSLQEQLRQANDCAASWICKYHAEETRFQGQNREIGQLRAILTKIKNSTGIGYAVSLEALHKTGQGRFGGR